MKCIVRKTESQKIADIKRHRYGYRLKTGRNFLGGGVKVLLENNSEMYRYVDKQKAERYLIRNTIYVLKKGPIDN